jgi:glycosyltransferase involved in cell wall biosynthesis
MVSVCLPTRNRSAQLRRAVESVLAQTYGDFEICVSDNASSDDTADVLNSFADTRIRNHRNRKDTGSNSNHITAIAHARGRYCAVIHDDTTWNPDFLERMVEPLNSDPSLDIAFCDHWVTDDTGRVRPDLTERFSRFYGRTSLASGRLQPFTSAVLRYRSILLTAAVIRRQILTIPGMLDPRSGHVIDFHLLARVSQAGGAAFYIPDRLAAYAVHSASISGTRQAEVWRDMRWACADLYGRATGRREQEELAATWAEAIANEAIAVCRTRQWKLLWQAATGVWEVPRSARARVGVTAVASAISLSLGRVQGRLWR